MFTIAPWKSKRYAHLVTDKLADAVKKIGATRIGQKNPHRRANNRRMGFIQSAAKPCGGRQQTPETAAAALLGKDFAVAASSYPQPYPQLHQPYSFDTDSAAISSAG